jgi:prepilin-type N-terminal cleavage/methylation domain-containing protein
MFKRNSNKGFTLIELLVVIAIIGMLSSIVLSSLATARQRARVTKSLVDLGTINNALIAYFAQNGVYPATGGNWVSYSNPGAGCGLVVPIGNFIPALVPNYLPTMPKDPLNAPTCGSQYVYYSLTGAEYKLIYNEPENCAMVKSQYPNLIDPARPCTGGYSAYGYWTAGMAAN